MPDVLTVGEAAAELRCSRQQIMRLIAKRRLPALDIGTGNQRCWRIRRLDLDALVAQPAAAVTSPPTRRKGKLPAVPRLV